MVAEASALPAILGGVNNTLGSEFAEEETESCIVMGRVGYPIILGHAVVSLSFAFKAEENR